MLIIAAHPAWSKKGQEKEVFAIELPEITLFGSYGHHEGATRLVLGEILDDGFAETPDFLGWYQVSKVVLPATRQETVRHAVENLLRETGLLASPGAERTHTLDVVIRRNRLLRSPTHYKYPLRVEVFLEFTIREAGVPVARVLACGNSENMAKVGLRIKALTESLKISYEHAMDDALRKFVDSAALRNLVGDNWKPGTPPAPPEGMGRIRHDHYYGPVVGKEAHFRGAYKDSSGLESLAATLAGKSYDRIILEEFEVHDAEFRQKRPSQLKATCLCLPGLIREHLGAFYPGAFDTVEFRGDGPTEGSLVISGDVYFLRMGQLKNGSEAEVHFRDGSTGEKLFTLRSFTSAAADPWWDGAIAMGLTMPKGAKKQRKTSDFDAWWAELDAATSVREKDDNVARDLAYVLVQALRPDYEYPGDLEVSFDGLPYP
jgi:hypothetical protein